MARRKTLPESLRAKLELAERLASLRLEIFGERGGPEMARRLGIPVRTWYNYEGGVTVPAEVVLKIIELTSVEPGWLLRGKGEKYRPSRTEDSASAPPEQSVLVGALLRTAIQLLEGEATSELGSATARFLATEPSVKGRAADLGRHGSPPPTSMSDHDALRSDRSRGEREWADARREGRCLTVPDDAMAPVLAVGSSIAFAAAADPPAMLDGRMVVAWVNDQVLVRWFEDQGDHGLLRAESSDVAPVKVVLDVVDPIEIRRVLWIEAVR